MLLTALALSTSCSRESIDITGTLDSQPAIFPDYLDVTVPENIAPLNFEYPGTGECALIVDGETIRPKKGGKFFFKAGTWKKWMSRDSVVMTIAVKKDEAWMAYKPFTIKVSRDRIDSWISYRLIPPGYQGWQEMGIYQRNLTNYSETSILANTLTGGNCLNCHTYNDNDPGKMVFHARAAFGGTLLVDGDRIEKLNTQTDSTISALVYPYWHPSGDYIAFSVNKTMQAFYNHDPNRIEVFDQASDVVVYDTRTRQITWSPLTRTKENFETFPTFSPDGKWLYFCSAKAVENMPADHRRVRYGLYRVGFDPKDMCFADSLECIYDAPADSASSSFPRISPDGRFLCFTRHGYGNFSIWHKDADLWLVDLSDGSARPMDGVNSDEVESFHTWSSSGRWLVFSSRRLDGLYTRPFFTHVDEHGNATKPFLLPQKDPGDFYKSRMESYNLPAFTNGKVSIHRRKLVDVVRKSPGIDVDVVK